LEPLISNDGGTHWKLSRALKLNKLKNIGRLNNTSYHKDLRLMNFPLFLLLLENQGNTGSLLRNQIRRILEVGVPIKITRMKINEKKI
jgi:hypothetical protein